MPRSSEKLLTIPEAAERLGTTPRFPRRLIEERRIRFVRVSTRHVRIPESAVEEWIAEGTVEPIRRPRGPRGRR
jgi:excisionase family DNA binding protein